jgi:phosphoglycolate phosphatase
VISHVAFDFDGTLADSLELAMSLYNAIAAEHGYRAVTAQNLAEMRSLSILQRCERLGVPSYRLPGLIVEVGRRYRKSADTIALHAGVPEMLRTLREAGLQVSIVSTNRDDTIRAILERHGVAHLVGEVHCSSRLFGKARLLGRLMRKTRLAPERLVYVGDEHRDIEASRAAGVRAVGVTWGADAEIRLREAAPDALAAKPEEIAELVRGWR